MNKLLNPSAQSRIENIPSTLHIDCPIYGGKGYFPKSCGGMKHYFHIFHRPVDSFLVCDTAYDDLHATVS